MGNRGLRRAEEEKETDGRGGKPLVLRGEKKEKEKGEGGTAFDRVPRPSWKRAVEFRGCLWAGQMLIRLFSQNIFPRLVHKDFDYHQHLSLDDDDDDCWRHGYLRLRIFIGNLFNKVRHVPWQSPVFSALVLRGYRRASVI